MKITRGRFLGMVGSGAAAMGASTLWPSARSGAASTGFFDGVDEASQPVMEAARKRIEESRKGDFTLTLSDEQGKPIVGTARARLVSLAFQFGAHFSGYVRRAETDPLARTVLEVVDDLFNTVVVIGYWKSVEPKPGQMNWEETDALLHWAIGHDKMTRFHCIIYSFPQWVKSTDTEQAWWDAFEARIKSVADRYGKAIHEYDVINEMVSDLVAWPAKKKEVESYRNFPYLWEPKNGARMLSIARKYLPQAKLVVLEARISTPESKEFQAIVAYDKALAALGAPFDYCGYQAHFFPGGTMPIRAGHPDAGPGAFTMKKLDAGLDLLASVGKPIVITEFNPPSRDGKRAEGEGQAGLTQDELAAWTVNYTTLVFSKPYTRGLSRWYVVDGGRGVDAGILTEKGEKKPVYHALRKLFKETWNTDWTGPLTLGKASFRGFYGTYEATVDGYLPARFTCGSSDECAAKVVLKR
ncbi:MAG: endo-1,4-beta-xylanase [Candidatus Sumerlaeota bacterium]|nr:endo-1,4-beta-xylanase [Candidatus Sumerlaeota bacterium]